MLYFIVELLGLVSQVLDLQLKTVFLLLEFVDFELVLDALLFVLGVLVVELIEFVLERFELLRAVCVLLFGETS